MFFVASLQARLAAESLRETLLAEQRIIEESSYSVSAILNSSNLGSASRNADLQEVLQGDIQYNIYRFNVRLESTSSNFYSRMALCGWLHVKRIIYILGMAYLLNKNAIMGLKFEKREINRIISHWWHLMLVLVLYELRAVIWWTGYTGTKNIFWLLRTVSWRQYNMYCFPKDKRLRQLMPFKPCRSCMYIDTNRKTHDVDLEDIEKSKADRLGKTCLFIEMIVVLVLFSKRALFTLWASYIFVA